MEVVKSCGHGHMEVGFKYMGVAQSEVVKVVDMDTVR